MTSELIPTSSDHLLRLTPAERLAELRGHVGHSLDAMSRAATVFAAMEAAGDDLSQVPQHLIRMLRQINARTLLPEVVVRLSGRLRQKVALMPLAEQRRLSEPGARVLLLAASGETIEIEAQRLTPEQVSQVFGDGYIRTPEEQRALLKPDAPARIPKRRGRPPLELEIDKERGTARINGKLLTKRQLLDIVEQL
jgi:hypothetical protein